MAGLRSRATQALGQNVGPGPARDQESGSGDSHIFSEPPQGPPKRPRGLAVRDDGKITVGSLTIGKTGIVFSEGTSDEEFMAVGELLVTMRRAYTWSILDWGLHSERHWGETTAALAARLGLTSKTTRNYLVVARAFDVSRRRDNLSLKHHAEVAALPPDEQDQWLDYAEAQHLSVAALREALQSDDTELTAPDGTVQTPLGRFSDRMAIFQRRVGALSRRATADERAQMAVWLRGLADQIQEGKVETP